MLLARLKKAYKYPRAVLFSGREYVKEEWRAVPPEFEESARKDERVEVKEIKDPSALDTETAERIEESYEEKDPPRSSRRSKAKEYEPDE